MPRGASYIKNLASKLAAIAAAHPDKAVQLWCEDEAREGQKGRTGRRWFTRGERPPGRCDKRFLSTYIFAAVRPGTDGAFALVLPEATAETMDLFLARFSATLPDDVHVALLLDQAGWHGAKALQVPPSITLLPLPPYSPELSPPERVWLHLRERHLSFCTGTSRPSWTRSAQPGTRSAPRPDASPRSPATLGSCAHWLKSEIRTTGIR